MTKAVLNLNIGILGHVDSGKTSLAKILSLVSSTACFDKNPQSQERGITIDLGFSSLVIPVPDILPISSTYSELQFTFVDCPGHASLIRTIIGGAQIIDLMILVIDITKGMQTQTAECLVIGEILCPKMIVVLNKVDQISNEKRAQVIEKMKKKMRLTLAETVFRDCSMVAVSANPSSGSPIGINDLLEVMKDQVFLPERHPELPAVFSIDHCFCIRGQGTVMTGTLWQGTINVNDMIEIPSLCISKKVKSIQIYRKSVEQGVAGDRMAVCVTQFDPKLLERGIACAPGLLIPVYAAIVSIQKVKYYKFEINSKSKFHISIGHETVLAKLTIFCSSKVESVFSFDDEYLFRSSLYDSSSQEIADDDTVKTQFALLEFERPILMLPNSPYISSKLDMDVHTNSCRIAFHGKVLHMIKDKTYEQSVLPGLKVYKNKVKSGLVDRLMNENEVICKNLFKKETRLDLFSGLKVNLSSGESGLIEGCFGQSGKIRVRIPEGLRPETLSQLGTKKSKKNKSEGDQPNEHPTVYLKFKQYIYDSSKRFIQCKD